MNACLIFVTALLVSAVAFADDKGSDVTKLPEGSVYEGTFTMSDGKKVTSSSGLEIKITKREGTKFEGEWTNTDNHNRAKIEGAIAGVKVSFKFTKVLEGKFPKDVIGNAKASGTLSVSGEDTTIKSGTYVVPGRNGTGKWEVKSKED